MQQMDFWLSGLVKRVRFAGDPPAGKPVYEVCRAWPRRANLSDALYCLPVGPLVFGFARGRVERSVSYIVTLLLATAAGSWRATHATGWSWACGGLRATSRRSQEQNRARMRGSSVLHCLRAACKWDPGDGIGCVFHCTMFLEAFPAQLSSFLCKLECCLGMEGIR